MKDIDSVAKLLGLNKRQVQNIIDHNKNHRHILDAFGCLIINGKFLFTERAIIYVAFQFMNKSQACFDYVNKFEFVNTDIELISNRLKS